jgi:hypothetical protein
MLRQSDSQACRTGLGLHRLKVQGMWGEMSVYCIAPDRTVGGEQQLVCQAVQLWDLLSSCSNVPCMHVSVCSVRFSADMQAQQHSSTCTCQQASTLNSRWVALHAWCALIRSARAALHWQAGM